MSGNLMDSATSLAMHAQRRGAGYYDENADRLHGRPQQRAGHGRRRRPPKPPQSPTHGPRQIYQVTPGDSSSFDVMHIADHENLALVWRASRANGGHAPGVDGMTFDVSPSQYLQLMRNLSQAVCERRYVPARTRDAWIPKPTGGYRALEIPTAIDRVMGAALAESLRPVLIDGLPRHYGAGASCHAILARMTVQAEDHGCYWIAVDDIQNFFPSIPRALAMDCFMREADRWQVPRLTLVQQGIAWLIRQHIYGHEGETRTVGLSQGSTFSPLAASIVLKEVLDTPTDRRIENRMILHRYADNIHVQGPDRSEVWSVMEDIQSNLNQYGMQLKGSSAQPTDVRVSTNQTILGVTRRWKNDSLLFDIPEEAWVRLKDRLCQTLDGTGPKTAQPILKGFISAFRPTFRDTADSAVDRIHRLIRKEGIICISKDTIAKWISAARTKWEAEVENIRNPPQPTPPVQTPEHELDTSPWDGVSAPWPH